MSLNLRQLVRGAHVKKITRWFIRGLFLVVVLWIVGVLAGRVLLHVTMGQIIKLTNSKVAFESIDYDFDGSVSLEKLVISPYQKLSDDDAIFKARAVYARFGLGSLLMLRPRLKEISLKDFTFNAQHDIDTDRWNFGALKTRRPKGRPGQIPRIHLENGMLKYSEVSNGQIKRTATLPVNASFGFDEKTSRGYKFAVTASQRPQLDRDTLTGFVRPGQIVLNGRIPPIDMSAFGRTWQVNALDAEFNYDRRWNYLLKLNVVDLRSAFTRTTDTASFEALSPLKSSGPIAALLRFFKKYQPAGQVNINLIASGNLGKLGETVLDGKVYCQDASICHRGFPYTVEHMTGRLDFTQNSVVLNNLCGYHDDVELFFNGFSREFGPNRRYDVRITSDNMALEDDLYQALNPKQKKFWTSFSPNGLAAIDYRLSRYPPEDKERNLTVRLLDANAVYSSFPYPLKNLTGALLFSYDTVTASELVSEANDTRITITGRATACRTDRPICDISVRAENVPLDSTLAAALPPGQKDFYEELQMDGSADADIKVFTPEQDLSPTTFVADVSFKETSLTAPVLRFAEYKETPLDSPEKDQPVLTFSDTSGKAVFTPDLVSIEDFAGQSKIGPISMTGQIRPGDQNRPPQYDLLLHTSKVQINDDLIDMLPAPMTKMVSELRPEGKVNLNIELSRTGMDDRPDYKITVDCLHNSINSRKFLYPITDVTGCLTITKDGIALDDIVATPPNNVHVISDTSAVKIDGQIMLADNGYDSADPELSNCNVALAAESLKVKGATLSNLTTAICYDPNRQHWLAKNLIADCYGGRLAGKLEVRHPTQTASEYLLQTGFDNVDLRQFLADITQKQDPNFSNNDTTGTMRGSLNVAWQTGRSLPRIGRCCLEITDMKVGKLSPLAKLLFVLKLTGPTDFAFEKMLVDAYINHNKVFIESFDLSGDAIAFCGSGSLDMKSWDIDLTLTARGKRLATAEPSVLQSLPDALGGGVVRMEVTGNVYDPQVRTRTLPVIADSLNIFGSKPAEKK
ncbi:MAG: hypothetical protein ACYTE5_03115 [Planctomycetota bacterium]|jgi:hypothetical protein